MGLLLDIHIQSALPTLPVLNSQKDGRLDMRTHQQLLRANLIFSLPAFKILNLQLRNFLRLF